MTSNEFLRDLAVMTLVFGVAAFIWFGWGQEDPPKRWRILLIIGSVLSLVVVVIGGFLTWQLWDSGSVFEEQAARRAFGIVCGIEFGLCALGATVLAVTKRPYLIAPWILLVVGVHFIPLALIFHDPGLNVLAALMIIGSVLAVVLHRRRQITPSALTGLTGGGSLLVFAARAAVLAVG